MDHDAAIAMNLRIIANALELMSQTLIKMHEQPFYPYHMPYYPEPSQPTWVVPNLYNSQENIRNTNSVTTNEE